MTEHCINNGTSQCQTKDATHIILKQNEFRLNQTIGFTYQGSKAEFMINLNSDQQALENRLTVTVTNMTPTQCYALIYEDPFDNQSDTSLITIPPKSDIALYSIKPAKFNDQDQLTVFFRLGDEYMKALTDIETIELVRLWKALQLLNEDPVYADMTVSNHYGHKISAHRAVVGAVSHVLDEKITLLKKLEDSSNKIDDNNNLASEHEKESDLKVGLNQEPKMRNVMAILTNLLHNTMYFMSSDTKNENELNSKTVNMKRDVQMLYDQLTNDILTNDNTNEYAMENPRPENYNLPVQGVNIKDLIRYIYGRSFEIEKYDKNLDDVEDLMSISNLYNLFGMKHQVEKKLIGSISCDIFDQAFQLATKYKFEQLKIKIIIFSCKFLCLPSLITKTSSEPLLHQILLNEQEDRKIHNNISFLMHVPNIRNRVRIVSCQFFICGVLMEVAVDNPSDGTIYVKFSVLEESVNAYSNMVFQYDMALLSNSFSPATELTSSVLFSSKVKKIDALVIAEATINDPAQGCLDKDGGINIAVTVKCEPIQQLKYFPSNL